MSVAVPYPSLDLPGFGVASKPGLIRQFVRSAAATTSRTTKRVSAHLGNNWQHMAAGMLAGAGARMLVTHFLAAGLATCLPGAVVTVATGLVAGATVVIAKKVAETLIYNITHEDKKSYKRELLSREAFIGMVTGAVGGMIGAEFIANNQEIMSALKGVGGHLPFVGAVAGNLTGAGRSIIQKVSDTGLRHFLSRDRQQNWRQAFFSKQALLGTVSGAALGFGASEIATHSHAIIGALHEPASAVAEKIHSVAGNLAEQTEGAVANVKQVASQFSIAAAEATRNLAGKFATGASSFFGFLKNFNPIGSARAETAYKIPGQIDCPKDSPASMIHARCVDPVVFNKSLGWMEKYVDHKWAFVPDHPTPIIEQPLAPPITQTIQVAELSAHEAVQDQKPLGWDSWRAQPGDEHSPALPATAYNDQSMPPAAHAASLETAAAASHDAISQADLAKLPKVDRIRLEEALAGKLSPEKALWALKNASFDLIDKDHDPEAGARLLWKGMEIAKAHGLGNTDIGQKLQRDLDYMDKIHPHNAEPARPIKYIIRTMLPVRKAA